jgi:hypothetical protein
MHILQAILYIAGVILIVLAAFGIPSRVSLALLGAGLALLAYTLPVITTAI